MAMQEESVRNSYSWISVPSEKSRIICLIFGAGGSGPSANQVLYPVSGPVCQVGPQTLRSPESVTALKNVDINPKCFTSRSEYAQLRFSGKDMNIKRLREDLVDLSAAIHSASLKWT